MAEKSTVERFHEYPGKVGTETPNNGESVVFWIALTVDCQTTTGNNTGENHVRTF